MLCIREAKELPDFLDSDEYIVRMRLAGDKLDEQLLALLRKMGDVATSLSTEELMIIHSLYYNKGVSAELEEYLPRLVEIGVVERRHGRLDLRKDLITRRPSFSLRDSIKNESINDSIRKNPANDSLKELNGDRLTPTERTTLDLLRINPNLTRKELVELTNKSEITIQCAIHSLQIKSLIERIGSKKSGYWKVAREE
jgi:ATP-dependent DNA helicase RecG